MAGLWRRCCAPTPKYRPSGGGGTSIIFTVHASDWRNTSTWKANSTAAFPNLLANGYEDPHNYRDSKRINVLHTVLHNMIGGWHEPEYPNTQVGAHAFSENGGESWSDTSVAFNLTVGYSNVMSTTFVQHERPHVVLNSQGEPASLISLFVMNESLLAFHAPIHLVTFSVIGFRLRSPLQVGSN